MEKYRTSETFLLFQLLSTHKHIHTHIHTHIERERERERASELPLVLPASVVLTTE